LRQDILIARNVNVDLHQSIFETHYADTAGSLDTTIMTDFKDGTLLTPRQQSYRN